MINRLEITLPTPVLSAEYVDRHEGSDHATAMRQWAEATARHAVTQALSIIRESHQGASLATETDRAEEAMVAAEEAFEAQMAGFDQRVKDAQYARGRGAAIEILAGMVARLIAEK